MEVPKAPDIQNHRDHTVLCGKKWFVFLSHVFHRVTTELKKCKSSNNKVTKNRYI
jgi:hypothetical protein